MARFGLVFFTAALVAALTGFSSCSGAPGSCPRVCFCPLDPRGRRQVICTTGGLQDPLPVLEMPSDAEVLRVSAPADRPNSLTLGPIFKGHRRLEEVSVTGSQVPALGAHSFWGLRRLQTLNVSHNAIAALIDTNFRGADGLTTLDLSHNRVESVPSAVFRHVRKLRVLNLSDNRLPELVPRILYGLAKLETLDLSRNPLGVLPPDRFTDVPKLRELYCAGCGIGAISGELVRVLPQLELLDLQDNRLAAFPPVRFAPRLKTLLLSDNHITAVEEEAVSGPPLETLLLANNRISTLQPRAFANATLSHLDLAHNRLNRLRSDAVSDTLPKLRILRLSGNPLRAEHLTQLIPRTRQLRHLELAELGLTRIPGELLRQSRHLKSLNLSGNFLSDFSASALFATPHLTTLDLSRNAFRGLDEGLVTAFTTMASLERVFLAENPWQCQQCHVAPLLDWLSDPGAGRHPHAAPACHDDPGACLKCAGPAGMAGRLLQELPKEEVPECETEGPVWPAWLGGAQRDDPRSPRDQGLHGPSISATSEEEAVSLGVFFGDHMALIVGVGCGMVLALLLVIVAALVLARRHSALYYTHEAPEHESSQKLMGGANGGGRNNNDNSPKSPHESPRRQHNTSRQSSKTSSPYINGPRIATIEEVESIAGSNVNLQSTRFGGSDLRAPRIVRLAASPLP